MNSRNSHIPANLTIGCQSSTVNFDVVLSHPRHRPSTQLLSDHWGSKLQQRHVHFSQKDAGPGIWSKSPVEAGHGASPAPLYVDPVPQRCNFRSPQAPINPREREMVQVTANHGQIAVSFSACRRWSLLCGSIALVFFIFAICSTQSLPSTFHVDVTGH